MRKSAMIMAVAVTVGFVSTQASAAPATKCTGTLGQRTACLEKLVSDLETKLSAAIATKASASDVKALSDQVSPFVSLLKGNVHIRFNDDNNTANQCLSYIQPGSGGAGFSGCDKNYKFQTLQIIPQAQ